MFFLPTVTFSRFCSEAYFCLTVLPVRAHTYLGASRYVMYISGCVLELWGDISLFGSAELIEDESIFCLCDETCGGLERKTGICSKDSFNSSLLSCVYQLRSAVRHSCVGEVSLSTPVS